MLSSIFVDIERSICRSAVCPLDIIHHVSEFRMSFRSQHHANARRHQRFAGRLGHYVRRATLYFASFDTCGYFRETQQTFFHLRPPRTKALGLIAPHRQSAENIQATVPRIRRHSSNCVTTMIIHAEGPALQRSQSCYCQAQMKSGCPASR